MRRIATVALLILVLAHGSTWALAMEPPETLAPEVRCTLKPSQGGCKANMPMHYYDPDAGKCNVLYGCGDTAPFGSKEECEKVCLPPQTLTLKTLGSWENDLYAQVSLEFPKGWEKPDFQVQVEGKDVNAKYHSGEFLQDRQMISLLFFPGRPGIKKVTVSASDSGQTNQVGSSLNWNPRAFVALLDYAGDRSLVSGREKIRVVTANLDNLTVRFNGAAANLETLGENGRLSTISPAWSPGLNILSISGKGPGGEDVRRNYTFVSLAGGFRQGEKVLLRMGAMGSRSGPFYSITVEGDAISVGPERMTNTDVLDAEGWLGKDTVLIRELRAANPGQSTVRIFEKAHFLEEKRLKEEIVVTVIAAGR